MLFRAKMWDLASFDNKIFSGTHLSIIPTHNRKNYLDKKNRNRTTFHNQEVFARLNIENNFYVKRTWH